MDFFALTQSNMEKAVEHLKHELSRLRTGRATPALVENIKVDYYGTPTPIKQVGQISIPDPKTIQIASWDQSAIPLVEKAIIAANIGLTPQVDGKLIRLNVPALTEDRRKDLVKQVKKLGEDARVSVRGVRREANEATKSREKAKAISEDDAKKEADKIQKITDQVTAEIDKIVDSKSKDLMTV
ncbi:MAG TPA: ribosome recycling factor [Bdellovibrionota bacterium]|jgi:ribosome recycling factor|nr:ribosome recycling factor [Bdellovibrionota bacterium]